MNRLEKVQPEMNEPALVVINRNSSEQKAALAFMDENIQTEDQVDVEQLLE